ncbi:hypothetical protein NADFUDRAFT_65992 [Nadsonia fulvescens var. elongata DSM 6958]|uniref:SYO1-like TPR repeats domain-containing protein n=1 Tax=Nadsonia fulvescens var. elongata DSM 6958 TaxID=857566 RepID=A0A1E3PHF4_9ASCO|nr:hypothetical protein NADFUDRAFT_65992 [Nadsonia fulvescens var. elongata DSM 6958]
MAKVKRKSRSSKVRKSSAPVNRSEAKDEQIRQTKIAPLISKLSSTSTNDRSMSISAITAMIDDPKLRTLLLKEGLIKIVLTQLLSDSSEEVVMESYGLLRNIVLEDGYDVCIHLWRSDILTAIQSAMEKSKVSFEKLAEAGTKSTKDERTLLNDYTENYLSLLIQLASSSDDIFDGVTKKVPGLADFTISLLQYSLSQRKDSNNADAPLMTTASLFSTLCEVLFVFSESNPHVTDEIIASPFVGSINDILSSKNLPVSSLVYLNGLKYNLAIEQSLSGSELDEEEIFNILQSLVSLVESINMDQIKADLNPPTDSTDVIEVNKADKTAINARAVIDGIQVALELFTAIAETITIQPSKIYAQTGLSNQSAGDDDEEEEEEDDALMNEDDEEAELYIQKTIPELGENEIELDEEASDSQSNSFSNTDENIITDDSTVGVLVNYLQNSVLPLSIKAFSYPEFVSRSMASLNNISWTLTTKMAKHQSWRSNAQELWVNIFPYLSSHQHEIDVVSSALGVLGAVSKTYNGNVPLNRDEVNFVINQIATIKVSAPEDEFNEYLIRAVALLASLAMAKNRTEVTKTVGDFFLSLLSGLPETPVEVVLEVLDNMFEIFGDASYEYDLPVFVEGQYMEKLNQLLSKVRQMTKKIDRRRFYQLRSRADEVTLNLSRFIVYKRNERS